MTTATANDLVWRASTTAENLAWAKKISDALTAIDVVKTADTGQINLTGTTLAIPSSPDTSFKSAGYEIRKLEAAGLPTIYLRIEYGVRNSGAVAGSTNNTPTLKLSVGTSTNGAGVLGGVLAQYDSFSNYGHYTGSVTTNAPRPFFFSSDGQNYLTMMIDPALVGATSSPTSAVVPLVYCLERSIDPATGNYDGEGCTILNSSVEIPSGQSATFRHVLNFTATSVNSGGQIPAQTDPMWTSSGNAGATTLFPVTVLLPRPKGPLRSCVYIYAAEAVPGTQFSTTFYGATRTYIACTKQNSMNVSPNSATFPCLRYD